MKNESHLGVSFRHNFVILGDDTVLHKDIVRTQSNIYDGAFWREQFTTFSRLPFSQNATFINGCSNNCPRGKLSPD